MKLVQLQPKSILATIFTICFLHHLLPAQQVSVPLDTIKQRLGFYKGNDTKREAALKQLFAEAGCNPANLSEQTVPTRKQPNLPAQHPPPSSLERTSITQTRAME
jgi:hypothetical protein